MVHLARVTQDDLAEMGMAAAERETLLRAVAQGLLHERGVERRRAAARHLRRLRVPRAA